MKWRPVYFLFFVFLYSCKENQKQNHVTTNSSNPKQATTYSKPAIKQKPEFNNVTSPNTDFKTKENLPPSKHFSQHLTEGITPAEPKYVDLIKLPGLPSPPFTKDTKSTEKPYLSIEHNLFYKDGSKLPALLFTIPGASPYFAKLLGMDFLRLRCPHKKVIPAPEYSSDREEVRLSFKQASWITFLTTNIRRADLGLYLDFEGPLGDMNSLGNLFPDVVSPTIDMPYSPLHAFGKTLYKEYFKSYLPSTMTTRFFFIQPAPPLTPLTRNDLETRNSFRRAMEKKYLTIEEANKAWGTHFEGFRYLDFLNSISNNATKINSTNLLNRIKNKKNALWADWLDYSSTNIQEQSTAFTELAKSVTGESNSFVVLNSSGDINIEPVASESETYRFNKRFDFLPEPGPVANLESTYLLELAKSSGKPIIDFGLCHWPEETPPWQQIAFLRHFIWRRLWHGSSALALPLNAGKALLSIPRFIAETDVLRHFLKSGDKTKNRIIFLHPSETMRTLSQETREKALQYLLKWWKALATQGFSVMVIPSEKVKSEDLLQTRVVLCPLSLILNDNSFSILEQFTQEGGIVITDWGSFQWGDNAGWKRNNTRKFLGLRHIARTDFKQKTIRLSTGEEIELRQRPVDNTTGDSVELFLAKIFGFRAGPAGKNPVSAVNQYGQGFVYSVLLNLPGQSIKYLLRKILWTHGISPQTKVTVEGGQEAEFVETDFKSIDRKKLISLFNLGPKREFLVSYSIEGDASYNLTNPLTASILPSPSNRTYWSSEEIREGFRVFLERGEVAVVLVEPIEDIAKIPVHGISSTREKMLADLENKSQIGPLFLVPPESGSPYSYPTARRILERSGFRTDSVVSSDKLINASAIWINHNTKNISATKILSFVKRGGGLLLEAASPPGSAPNNIVQGLLNALHFKLGLQVQVKANRNDNLNQSLPLVLFGISKHEVTEGINTIILPYACKLEAGNSEPHILIHGGEKVFPVGSSVAYECLFGAGRVIVISACWWTDPLVLELGDNAKFLARCSRYLAKRDPTGLSEEDIKNCLFISRDYLITADQDNLYKKTTFEPYPIMNIPNPFPLPSKLNNSYWTTFSQQKLSSNTMGLLPGQKK